MEGKNIRNLPCSAGVRLNLVGCPFVLTFIDFENDQFSVTFDDEIETAGFLNTTKPTREAIKYFSLVLHTVPPPWLVLQPSTRTAYDRHEADTDCALLSDAGRILPVRRQQTCSVRSGERRWSALQCA